MARWRGRRGDTFLAKDDDRLATCLVEAATTGEPAALIAVLNIVVKDSIE
jgi:hypothetical protein